jgi:Icc-related predicted phosphoesterase
MKLWIMSDLHLESVPHPDQFDPVPPECDVLVCAGDVFGGHVEAGFKTLRRLAKQKPVITVLGNHEYWNGTFERIRASTVDLAHKYTITLLDGGSTTLGDVNFVGVTLWTDFKLGSPLGATHKTGERISTTRRGKAAEITVGDECAFHATDLNILTRKIKDTPPGRKLVVVTHHAPLPECLRPPGRAHPMAGISASDLSHLTDSGDVKLWVHGHLHHTVDLVRDGGTRVVCNPAGRRFENPKFDEGLVIDV